MYPKHEYFRSKKIRDSAKGMPCTFRLPDVCNNDDNTTVFCHLNYGWAGKGGGIKADDVGCYGCSECHRAMDGGNEKAWVYIHGDKEFYWLRGLFETQRLIMLMIKAGELEI